jgi:hypothetical protein
VDELEQLRKDNAELRLQAAHQTEQAAAAARKIIELRAQWWCRGHEYDNLGEVLKLVQAITGVKSRMEMEQRLAEHDEARAARQREIFERGRLREA